MHVIILDFGINECKQIVRISESLISSVFKIDVYNMIISNTLLFKPSGIKS